jgi:hypothetical protein
MFNLAADDSATASSSEGIAVVLPDGTIDATEHAVAISGGSATHCSAGQMSALSYLSLFGLDDSPYSPIECGPPAMVTNWRRQHGGLADGCIEEMWMDHPLWAQHLVPGHEIDCELVLRPNRQEHLNGNVTVSRMTEVSYRRILEVWDQDFDYRYPVTTRDELHHILTIIRPTQIQTNRGTQWQRRVFILLHDTGIRGYPVDETDDVISVVRLSAAATNATNSSTTSRTRALIQDQNVGYDREMSYGLLASIHLMCSRIGLDTFDSGFYGWLIRKTELEELLSDGESDSQADSEDELDDKLWAIETVRHYAIRDEEVTRWIYRDRAMRPTHVPLDLTPLDGNESSPYDEVAIVQTCVTTPTSVDRCT